MQHNYQRLFALSIALTIAACAGAEPDVHLLDDEDDWADRRARMNVTVRLEGPNGTESRDLNSGQLRVLLRGECLLLRDTADERPGPHVLCDATSYGALASCQEATCASNLLLCMAHRAREYAETLAPIDTLTVVDGYAATVIPQDAASRAGLDELALTLAQEALGVAGENLRRGGGLSASAGLAVCTPADMTTVPAGGVGRPMNHAESLAFDLAEAVHLVEEAGNAAVEVRISPMVIMPIGHRDHVGA